MARYSNLVLLLATLACSILSSNGFSVAPRSAVASTMTAARAPTALFMAEVDADKLYTGTVKWFNTLKGFGFILPDEEGMPDVFVHQSEIYAEGFRSLMDGESVEYKLTTDDNKRHKAVSVTGPNGAHVQGAPFRPANDFDSY
mmetsp:Transcript_34733/g.72289  ORF Transcript_34733/g.72289 Transcript_34733/m.72289 type:complete len:143 (-) Transcript_34733:875-1303(-)